MFAQAPAAKPKERMVAFMMAKGTGNVNEVMEG
jgi:hypothetical protein